MPSAVTVALKVRDDFFLVAIGVVVPDYESERGFVGISVHPESLECQFSKRL
jgi:hypothetical protein